MGVTISPEIWQRIILSEIEVVTFFIDDNWVSRETGEIHLKQLKFKKYGVNIILL